MALLSAKELSVAFSDLPLFEKASFQIDEGERIALVGRNGTGKSTLMKTLTGEIVPIHGEISKKPNLRIAYLPQEVPQEIQGNVYDIIYSSMPSQSPLETAEINQEEWQFQQWTDRIISQLKLDKNAVMSSLSAGWKRRVLLAKGLAMRPHLLLLDEPTNHLDIDMIEWLEKFLHRFDGALLFVTHDRTFTEKLATRILELDRGNLIGWNCDYQTYLVRKEESLDIEAEQFHKFDKKLAQEEAWLRRSPKARRTRNEGRVRVLLKMREERRSRRDTIGQINLALQQAESSGDLVIEAKNISFSYSNITIVHNFSTMIMRGDKVGVIGPNGIGKTTLLKILLKEIEPDQGSVRHGARLDIAYYDQLRNQLNHNESVILNVGGGSDHILFNGKPRHIIGYLKDFLFTPERAHSPIRILSGGERNRVLLAKLFSNPANLLVLDEPTNDLDLDTLEILENLLVEFSGTVLLVSHDRAFLNNVVTGTLALEGNGNVNEYVGGYDDWLRQRKPVEEPYDKNIKSKSIRTQSTQSAQKLSYIEKRTLQIQYREYLEIPSTIERLELERDRILKRIGDPEFYKQPLDQITAAQNQFATLEESVQHAYQRWEDLALIFESIDTNSFM